MFAYAKRAQICSYLRRQCHQARRVVLSPTAHARKVAILALALPLAGVAIVIIKAKLTLEVAMLCK